MNISVNVILARMDRGWTEQEAVSTPKQAKGTAKLLTLNGETLPINGWAKKLGMNFSTLHLRLEQGWPIEDVLSTEDFNGGRERIKTRNACSVQGCKRFNTEVFEGERVDTEYCFRHYKKFLLWGDPSKGKSDFRYATELRDGEIKIPIMYRKYESAKKNAKRTGVSFEFEDYHDFYDTMGDCPEGKILSRKDFSKGFSRKNCFWDTRSSHNSRGTKHYWHRKNR
jgi:hypothetical protein